MKSDRQYLDLFLSHLPAYYGCLRLVYDHIDQSGEAGRLPSLFNARRMFSRKWYLYAQRSAQADRETLYQTGMDRASRSLRRHYRKQSAMKAGGETS